MVAANTKPQQQAISITLGSERHVWPTADGCLPLLVELGRMHGASRAAYMASAARLGSLLWQLRRQAPYGTWKNLIARADIDEKLAQRVMRVAVRLAPTGEIDMSLVAQMREVARANGCTLPFVQADEALESWNQAARLVKEAEKSLTPRLLTRQTPDARGQSGPVDGRGSGVGHGRGVGAVVVPPVLDHTRQTTAAEAMGLTEDEYEQYLADRDAEAAGVEDVSADGPMAITRGAAGVQLGLDALYVQRGRLSDRMERVLAGVTSGAVEAGRVAAAMDECERVLARLGV